MCLEWKYISCFSQLRFSSLRMRSFSKFYRRDPVEMIFMIAVGIASWIIIEKQYCIEKNTLAFVICSIFYFLVTFLDYERISNIISSLINPITSVCTDNWIGYRMNLAWNAWFADMSFFR